MGKEVRVFAFDDLEFARTGDKTVEAERISVPLAFDGKSVVLDLTNANYGKLAAQLREWLGAGNTPAASGAATPGAKRGRKPNAYYLGLQAYAEHKGVKLKQDSAGKFVYPDALRAEYEQSLIDAGKPG